MKRGVTSDAVKTLAIGKGKQMQQTQERNERCGCGSGAKYKKCCGRFSVPELCDILTKFASNYRRKDALVEKALKMLADCGSGDGETLLCLVSPKPLEEGFIQWTYVGTGVAKDEREAVVTRRVLAGYIPVGCLKNQSGWRALINKQLVPEEVQAAYVAFARVEMNLIAATLDGKLDSDDSWTAPVKWSDRSYPGQPVKQRRAGTIRVEVDVQNRSVRIVCEPLSCYLDAPVYADLILENEEETAVYVAQHVICATERAEPPYRPVPGDIFEVYLIRSEGAPKLLARENANATPSGLTGSFGMGGSA